MVASKSASWKADGTKALVWFHRWLGVATCLILAMWFASGAVLLFQPFPSLPKVAQMEGSEDLRIDAVRFTPAQAVSRVNGDVIDIRLVQRAGAPAYLVETDRGVAAVGARDGKILPPIGKNGAEAIGSAFLKRQVASVHGPLEYDQWIVDNGFDSARPYYRVDSVDEAGTQIYVSAVTGEVLQRTRASERAWNWVGAVLHWVYFTPLRASFSAWDKVVWSVSLLATLVAIAGITLGLIRTFAVRRAGRKGLTFFRQKWLKYHHVLGLFVGIFVIGWMMSGWLSMDHGRLFSRGQPSSFELDAYQGRSISDTLSQISLPALSAIPSTKVIRVNVVGGESLLASTDASGHTSAFDALGEPLNAEALDGRIRRAVAKAWPKARLASAEDVGTTDFYAVAEGMPNTVRKYILVGERPVSLYVDTATSSIVTVMDESRAAYSWIYYALHTFKVPGLIDRPLLRKSLVLIPLILGFVFSLTGVVIGIQRLRKTF